MNRIRSYFMLLFVLLAGCNTDLQTKKMVAASLKDEPPVSIVSGFLDMKYTENRAAGFSLLNGLHADIRLPLLIGLQALATTLLCVFILFQRKKAVFLLLPYLIILSGALGNLIDRVRNGYVVDFIHFHIKDRLNWPVFNVADILIVIGVGLAILGMLSRRPPADAPRPSTSC